MSATSGEEAALQLVAAIQAGDVDSVATLLAADPGLASVTATGNDRSMLHCATDWPGHWPNARRTIGLLIAAGADPHVTFPSESPGVAETPLHWAASSGDVAALDALLDGGADVDALGGIFGGCTPFEEAVIFEHYDAAARLLARGASWYLPGVAALDRIDLVTQCFAADGALRPDVGNLPHWSERPPTQIILDRALQFACRAGHLDVARYLHERGADANSKTPVETTPLDEATKNHHEHVVEWLRIL